MKEGDKYGEYELIFNQFYEKQAYNPCLEFFNNGKSTRILRAAMRQFAPYTGYAASKLQLPEDCDTKRCKAQYKLEMKHANKLKFAADRQFESGFTEYIGGAETIGGTLTEQMETLVGFLKTRKGLGGGFVDKPVGEGSKGCSLNLLGVMPPSYRLSIQDECKNLLKFKTPSEWVLKP